MYVRVRPPTPPKTQKNQTKHNKTQSRRKALKTVPPAMEFRWHSYRRGAAPKQCLSWYGLCTRSFQAPFFQKGLRSVGPGCGIPKHNSTCACACLMCSFLLLPNGSTLFCRRICPPLRGSGCVGVYHKPTIKFITLLYLQSCLTIPPPPPDEGIVLQLAAPAPRGCCFLNRYTTFLSAFTFVMHLRCF